MVCFFFSRKASSSESDSDDLVAYEVMYDKDDRKGSPNNLLTECKLER